MKYILLLVFFITCAESHSQNVELNAKSICDSIQKHPSNNTDTLESIKSQIEVQSHFMIDSTLIEETSFENVRNSLNVYNYKLNRHLNKTCKEYRISYSTLFGTTRIIDLEGILNHIEIDSIDKLTNKLAKEKQVQILIITIDDYFPQSNITDFANAKGDDWHIGSKSKNGGIVIVLSKAFRVVRISTDNISKKYLDDIQCEKIIQNTLIPKFKTENYYQGLIDCIYEVGQTL